MGLLDDAIREHLELKRLRGADPGEVAREEREVLGQRRRDADTPGTADGADQPAPQEPPVDESLSIEGALPPGGGQETVEINMEAEFRDVGGATGADAEPSASKAAPSGGPALTHSDDESLEWEMPDDQPETPPTEGHAGDLGAEGDEHVEDVLEETPDFLRETPEQERLWFEQRPPRDFDFNE